MRNLTIFLLLSLFPARAQQLTPECQASCDRAGLNTGVMLLGICSASVGSYRADASPQDKAACQRCLETTCSGPRVEEARIIFPPAGTELGAQVVFKWTKGSNISRYRLLVGTARGEGDVFSGELTTLESKSIPISAAIAGKPVYVWLSSFDGKKWLSGQIVSYKTEGAATLYDKGGRPSLNDYFFGNQPNGTQSSGSTQSSGPVGAWLSQDGWSGVTISPYGRGFSLAFRPSQQGSSSSAYVEWNGTVYVGRFVTRDRAGRLIGSGTQWLVPHANGISVPWRDDRGFEGTFIMQRAPR